MNTDDESLKTAVSAAVQDDPVGYLVRDFSIETARDQNEDEFLRISLLIDHHEDDLDQGLENLLTRIEDVVALIDHRYASVRFLDDA